MSDEIKKAGCEPADKCCLCMPIVCGMKTLSTLCLLTTVGATALNIILFTKDTDAGLIALFVLIPSLVSSFFFARFLFIDPKGGRD